jgi:hypothetical protein
MLVSERVPRPGVTVYNSSFATFVQPMVQNVNHDPHKLRRLQSMVRAGVHAPTKSVSVSISLFPPVQPRSGVHTYRQNRDQRYKTTSDHMDDEWAPIPRIYRAGRRRHADMSVVVPITLSCRPRVLHDHKVTWNISTTDIVADADTDTDFVGACTPALRVPDNWNERRAFIDTRQPSHRWAQLSVETSETTLPTTQSHPRNLAPWELTSLCDYVVVCKGSPVTYPECSTTTYVKVLFFLWRSIPYRN